MNEDQHRKVRNIIRWQRIGCIVVKISETLGVSLKEALDMFREPELKDREILAALIDEFYHSDGVLHPIPKAYIQSDIRCFIYGKPFY